MQSLCEVLYVMNLVEYLASSIKQSSRSKEAHNDSRGQERHTANGKVSELVQAEASSFA